MRIEKMKLSNFIGRKEELKQLNLLLDKRSASLVVVRGRRRVGKSRLIEEFAKKHRFLRFSGIPPTNDVTAQSQRDIFFQQLGQQVQLPWNPAGWESKNWSSLFYALAEQTREGRVIILFDEISWMGSHDPLFLGQLKNAWDMEFKKNDKLILIFCGSVSTWIEKNIIKSTGFFGRISSYLTLGELPLSDCNLFIEKQGFIGTTYDKLKLLSVTGGIPSYLEQIQPKLNADDNIKNVCFRKDGVLVNEFDLIFHDLFTKRSELYKKIIEKLADGPLELNDLHKELSYQKSGVMGEYLDELVKARFIKRDYTWLVKSGEESRLSHYRLSDNYLRFYLKYVENNRVKIEKDGFRDTPLSTLPGWDTIMGFQFENLVLNNRQRLWQLLKITPGDIVADNPFFQRKTSTQKGCQVDYLIQTRNKLLFICEIKFSRNEIKGSVVENMKEKIRRISIPKGFALSPVLIHVNGVEDALTDSDYFAHVIDFGSLLESDLK
jgi:AAA+ ATPase superfamily predicted ATPase